MCKNIIPIAWDGISLSIPADWQIGRLDRRHLVFQENGAAAMEIKWNRIRGRFSITSQLKQLAAAQGRRHKKDFGSWQPPAEWARALERFQVGGFQWETQEICGRGVVLYCSLCRTATLIQFFVRPTGRPPIDRIAAILDSFQDHREDGLMAWSLFDIQMLLPDGYLLSEHAFKPGNFTLTFTDRGRTLTLFRWAPAAALLGDKPLSVFASAAIGLVADQFAPCFFGEYPAVQWHSSKGTPKLWPLRRVGGTPPYRKGRIWHVTDANRILGVGIADTRPIAAGQLSEICESYEIVS